MWKEIYFDSMREQIFILNTLDQPFFIFQTECLLDVLVIYIDIALLNYVVK